MGKLTLNTCSRAYNIMGPDLMGVDIGTAGQALMQEQWTKQMG